MWVLAAAATASGLAQVPFLQTMQEHGSSIYDLELVFTSSRAAKVVVGLAAEGRSAARTSLWLDYAFVVSWAGFLCLACGALVERAQSLGRSNWRAIGLVLSWAVLAAALLDVVENTALLWLLAGHLGQPQPAIASVSAVAVFPILGVTVLYAVAGWFALRRRRTRGR